MNTRGKNYVFTANNPIPEEISIIHGFIDSCLESTCPIRYIVFQYERGGEGNFHIQGYIQLRERTRCGRVREILGGRAHVELRRGVHQEARDYCIDPEKIVDSTDLDLPQYGRGPFESGDPVTGQGQRTDIESLHQALQEGVGLVEISDSHFGQFVRYHRAIALYQTLHAPPRDFPCLCDLHYGVSGAGKTHYILSHHPGAYWIPGGPGGWFDNYQGESTIVLDDFDGTQLPFDIFKRLIDASPLLLKVKGGHANCRASLVVISSNTKCHMWYPGTDPITVSRRITNTITYVSRYAPPVDD